MTSFRLDPAVAADAAAVAEVVAALEASLYGQSLFSQADLEDEWLDLDLKQNARVVRDGDRIVGYGAVRDEGELWDGEAYVHPDALGRGIGKLIATGLEEHAASRGARRILTSGVRGRLGRPRTAPSRSATVPVRVFREMRIELETPPPAPKWPQGLRVVRFDPERDAVEFHAAQEEAFADHWEFTPRDFESWSKSNLGSQRFEPTLWCVVRAGDEIVAGTVCTGETYGGGWVQALFTRRQWRTHGIGTALLGDSFRRFWERGEHSIGLGVDAANETGAFRLYERAGMSARLGLAIYEKHVDDRA